MREEEFSNIRDGWADTEDQFPPPNIIVEVLARFIHYPDCWDTIAYPTLIDAYREVIPDSQCSECRKDFIS